MLNAEAMARSLEAGLERGVQYAEPYALTVFKPFPDDFYEELLANLPDDRFYSPLSHKDAVRPDGSSTRMILALTERMTGRFPASQQAFWSAFNAAIRSAAVRTVFLRHMGSQVEQRYGVNWDALECYPTARLGCDSDGYKILPHPDGENRVYSAQIYLTSDASRPHIGTSIYRRVAGGEFEEVRRIPYLPNTAFCFFRTDETFHGVEPVSISSPRRNLHISCFKSDPGF